MEILSCPECGAPAEIEPRGSCPSTDGPVAMVAVLCARRHWFLMPRDLLDPVMVEADADVAVWSSC
jgi:hypothetical protein